LVFFSTLVNAQKKVSEEEKYGGTLTIAIPYDTKTLDPRYFWVILLLGPLGTKRCMTVWLITLKEEPKMLTLC
jgi:hypothetical protein